VPIPESQLDIWSRLGASGPSRDTYAAVKLALEDSAAPFAAKNPEVFLQGSYSNDTNVARDSDVDVVTLIKATFAHDANTLSDEDYQAFKRAYPESASYTYAQYKADVAAWLTKKFGAAVQPGRKAIFIPQGANRRECDVLPAIEFRYYYRFKSMADQPHAKGICFYLPDGTQIVNFPKQHGENCTKKHAATSEWFKPTVRVFKNMRNHMVDRKLLHDGTAPSYFIEGMLYNVPPDRFGGSFGETFVAAFNYLVETDRSSFTCANGIHPLLGDTHTSWPSANCQSFIDALRALWNGSR
jgi:hypothetical protein